MYSRWSVLVVAICGAVILHAVAYSAHQWLGSGISASAKDITPNATKVCAPSTGKSGERYRLPPPKNLLPGISFSSDWSQNATGGWYGEQIIDSCRMQVDGFLTWHGKPAVRVEVQPNDDPLSPHSNSERAEMLYMQSSNGAPIAESKKSGVQYYATSYYFPRSWRGEQLPWSAFSPIDCSKDENRCNSWSFVLQFYGWGGLAAAATEVGGPELYSFNGAPFLDGELIALGKWTDLIFEVDWQTGKYTIWRRDEGAAKFARVLTGITPVPSREIYFKQGLYRGGAVNGRTDVLWIGPTSRGSSFASVEKQSFGTESGPN